MPDCIISDTSCLILLTNIGELDILQRVYGRIITTPEVAIEYKLELPEWIEIAIPSNKELQHFLEQYIDKGEASAIALAAEKKDSIVILDDYSARKMAEKLDLKITGTLGVIIKAKKEYKINSVELYINKLKAVNFRISNAFIEEALKEAGETK